MRPSIYEAISRLLVFTLLVGGSFVPSVYSFRINFEVHHPRPINFSRQTSRSTRLVSVWSHDESSAGTSSRNGISLDGLIGNSNKSQLRLGNDSIEKLEQDVTTVLKDLRESDEDPEIPGKTLNRLSHDSVVADIWYYASNF